MTLVMSWFDFDSTLHPTSSGLIRCAGLFTKPLHSPPGPKPLLGDLSEEKYGIIWEFFPYGGGGGVLLNPKTFVI